MSANRVLRSIETDDGGRCVDIFLRSDDSYGFEEFRRDGEDLRGWFPIGHYGARAHGSEAAALDAAMAAIPWLAEAIAAHR